MNRLATIIAVLLVAVAARALELEGSQLRWTTVDSGGATARRSSNYLLGDTIGQPDAHVSSGGGIILAGGFWSVLRAAAALPTPTTPPSRTATTSPATTTKTLETPTPTASAALSPGTTQTVATTPTSTPTPHPSITTTPAPTPTATSTSPLGCTGDCSEDATVTVDEIVTMVNIALGVFPVTQCEAGDVNGDHAVTVDEIVGAVNAALFGC